MVVAAAVAAAEPDTAAMAGRAERRAEGRPDCLEGLARTQDSSRAMRSLGDSLVRGRRFGGTVAAAAAQMAREPERVGWALRERHERWRE